MAQGPQPPSPPYRAPTSSVSVSSQVEAYDELTYRCKADDDFNKISQQFFQSPKYAKALQLFNRNHPRASDALLHDPPNLSGQQVYIPPLRILEKYYGSAIADYKPLPAVAPPPLTPGAAPAPAPGTATPTGSTSGMTPIGAAAPAATAPVNPTPGAPTALTGGIQAAGAWTNPNTPKYYRVKNNGEMYRDIAAKTLNNRERWGEIYQMNNRQFPPEYPVPAGTMLRLPPDARVSPADAQ
jgi:hypothetical protein